jgi:hypothetical protein
VARQEHIDPLPLRVDIGRPAHRLQVSDIRQALELRPAPVRVVQLRDFGQPLLPDNLAPAALQDKAVLVLRAPVDRRRVSRNVRAVVAEAVLGKVRWELNDPAQAFPKPSQASRCMRESLPHRADVRLSRNVTRKVNANFIPCGLGLALAPDAPHKLSLLRQFNANHARSQ